MSRPQTARKVVLAVLIIVAFYAILASAFMVVVMPHRGELYHKMEYDTATFIGPSSDGYSSMMTGEIIGVSQFQHDAVADVYIRLVDGTVFRLSKFPEKEAKDRNRAEWEWKDPATDLRHYYLRPSDSMLLYREEELVGAIFKDGVEVSKQIKGPFLKFPLSAAQVRELMGKPKRETTYRVPVSWR